MQEHLGVWPDCLVSAEFLCASTNCTTPPRKGLGSTTTKFFWPGKCGGTLRFLSPAATCLPHTLEASHCSFSLLNFNKKAVNTTARFFGLTKPEFGIRTRVYRFSSRRSIPGVLNQGASILLLTPRSKIRGPRAQDLLTVINHLWPADG